MMKYLVIIVCLCTLVCGCDEKDVFVSSAGEEVDGYINDMWDVYGRAEDGTVQKWGNEATYFELLALKMMWSNEKGYKDELRKRLIDYPCSENGYIWSWGNEEGWPTHHARHYETNGRFITAVWRYLIWSGDKRFLDEVDETTTASTIEGQKDVSQGLSVLAKVRKAMKFQLDELGGADGVVILPEDDSDGTVNAKPTDYWDNYLNGYKSAYINIYFYSSAKAMTEIEAIAGNKKLAKFYAELAEKIKVEFNETFWNEEKGRYVGSIDKDGRIWDFGFTYINTEAVFYGLADEERARKIYEWLDGKRIIESDLQEVNGEKTGSVGEDIYAYRWAARSNTRALESVKVDGKYWWWDVDNNITVGGENPSAKWDEHVENGGAIFYTSFYDVMGRIKNVGADNGWRRFSAILDEYKKDQLKRDPLNNVGAPWKFGIIGEFPESGMVPAVVVYGFMGIDASKNALVLSPRLPEDINWMGVGGVVYQGKEYGIKVHKDAGGNLAEVVIVSDKSKGHRLVIGGLASGKGYVLQTDRGKRKLTANEEGFVELKNINFKNMHLKRQLKNSVNIEWEKEKIVARFENDNNIKGYWYPRLLKLKDSGLLCACDVLMQDGSHDVIVMSTNSGGESWEYLSQASFGEGQAANGHLIELGSGELLCSYRLVNEPVKSIKVSRSRDKGKSWEDISTVVSNEAGVWEPFIIEKDSGELLVFYANEEYNNAGENFEQVIEMQRSFDGGITWSGKRIISKKSFSRDGMPVAGVLKNGDIMVVLEANDWPRPFKIMSVRSKDGGETWGERKLIYRTKEAGKRAAAPYVLAGENDEIIVSYQSDEDKKITGEFFCEPQILVSFDDGENWTKCEKPFESGEKEYRLWSSLMRADDGGILAATSAGEMNKFSEIRIKRGRMTNVKAQMPNQI